MIPSWMFAILGHMVMRHLDRDAERVLTVIYSTIQISATKLISCSICCVICLLPFCKHTPIVCIHVSVLSMVCYYLMYNAVTLLHSFRSVVTWIAILLMDSHIVRHEAT